jgi:hypothetical protein
VENFKKEMQKNAVFAVGVSEGQWKCQDELRSGDCTVCYSGGERAERVIAIAVHTSVVRKVLRSLCVMTESLFLS